MVAEGGKSATPCLATPCFLPCISASCTEATEPRTQPKGAGGQVSPDAPGHFLAPDRVTLSYQTTLCIFFFLCSADSSSAALFFIPSSRPHLTKEHLCTLNIQTLKCPPLFEDLSDTCLWVDSVTPPCVPHWTLHTLSL